MNKKNSSLIPVWILGGLLVVSGSVVTIFRGVIAQVNNLYPLSLPVIPYFIANQAGLLYLAMPFVILSSLIFLMAPGILLVLVNEKSSEWSVVVLKGFGLTFIIYLILTVTLKSLLEGPVDSTGWISLLWVANFLAWLAILLQAHRGRRILNPFQLRHNRRRFVWTLGIPVVLVIALLPVVFWQDLNPDGVEALMLGRSLLEYQLPRLPVEPSLAGLGLGMVAGSYPVSWLVMLFGAMEATARLPLLIYIPAIFMAVISITELGKSRHLNIAEEGLLAFILGIFVVTLTYNDTYHVYSADIASPALFDILITLCILAMVYFFWQDNLKWFSGFAVLGLFARPTSLLVMGLMIPAILVSGDNEIKKKLSNLILVIGICLVFYFLYEKILAPYLTNGVGTMVEPGSSILFRLRYLRLDDFGRILYLLIPAGILPALSLLAFWMHDPLSRFASILTISYFLFFYFVAFVALHHFAPAMVLPLIVFGRILLDHEENVWLLGAGYVLACLSMFLSLPNTFAPDRITRLVGNQTLYKIGSLDDGYAEVQHAFSEKDILLHLFREPWEVEDPSREYIGSPGQILYYASQPKQMGDPEINYLVQPVSDPDPAGYTVIANEGDTVLYVRDIDQWNRDRYRPINTDYRSEIYAIPQHVLFKFMGVPVKAYSIDLLSILPQPLKEMLLSKLGESAP